MTPAIQPPVNSLSLVVEPAIDAIALSIQAFGALLPAGALGTIRTSVQAPVDAVTAVVEPLFYPVAAIVEARFPPVARVRHGAGAKQESCSYGKGK